MADDLPPIGDPKRVPPLLELGHLWRYNGGVYCFRPSCEGCKWDPTCQREETVIKVGAGVNIRRAFMAPPGWKLVSIDYSGIELRIAGQLSGEPSFIKAFQEGRDLHYEMAKLCFKTDTPTKEQRRQTKCANFGNLYLGSAFTLSRQSDLSVLQAGFIWNAWWKSVPTYKRWCEDQEKLARENGCVYTFFGRKRPMGDMIDRAKREEITGQKGKGKGGWGFVKRTSVNSPVQGCLRPEVMILTDQGYLTIQDLWNRQCRLEVLPKVWTGNGFYSFTVLNRGKAPYVNLHIKRRGFLACDDRHKVKIAAPQGWEWADVKDLRPGDKVAIARPTLIHVPMRQEILEFTGVANNSHKLKIDFAHPSWNYFVGHHLGDGCFGEKDSGYWVSVLISDDREGVKIGSRVQNALAYQGFLTVPNWSRNDPTKNRLQWSISCKALGEALLQFGLTPNCGAPNKKIPERCFSAPTESRVALLRGLFDSDGTKDSEDYGWHNSSFDLIKGIYLLLRTLGIDARYSETSQGTYKLDVVSKEAFASTLSLSYVRDRRDAGGPSLLPFQVAPVYRKLEGRELDQSAQVLRSRLKGGGTTQLSTAIRLLGQPLDEMHLYDEVEAVDFLQEEGETYTLSVDDCYHQFDSEGVISKNTAADLLKLAMLKVHEWIYGNQMVDRVKLNLSVHDELVFYVKDDAYLVKTCREIQKIMCPDLSSWGWKVPIETDCEIGDNWALLTNIKDLDPDCKKGKIKTESESLIPQRVSPDKLYVIVNTRLTEANQTKLELALLKASHANNPNGVTPSVMVPVKLKIGGKTYSPGNSGQGKLKVNEFLLRKLVQEIPGVEIEDGFETPNPVPQNPGETSVSL